MPRKQPPKDNPLRVLFDYVDDDILKDPKKLSEIVKRQKRMLQSAFHPDLNRSGPFSNEEAEARSKAINGSPELELLVDTLGLVTGEKPESYQGEVANARRVLEGWINDYQTLRYSSTRQTTDQGELSQRVRILSAQVVSLTEELRQARAYASDLEEKLEYAERRVSEGERVTRKGITRVMLNLLSNIFPIKARVPFEVKNSIRQHFDKAEQWAKSDRDRYEWLWQELEKARELAQEWGVNFDRTYGKHVTIVLSSYVDSRLKEAKLWIRDVREEWFKGSINTAIRVAENFDRVGLFRPKIVETVEAFVSAAVEKGRSYLRNSSWYSGSRAERAEEYFDLAQRIGKEYGVKINLSTDAKVLVKQYLHEATSRVTPNSYSYEGWDRRYDRMCEEIQKARAEAKKFGFKFDREFDSDLTRVLSTYVNSRLGETVRRVRDTYTSTWNIEEMVLRDLNAVTQAAETFGKASAFRPSVMDAVNSFINAIVERGQGYIRSSWYADKDTARELFDIARRLGGHYGIKVDIPTVPTKA